MQSSFRTVTSALVLAAVVAASSSAVLAQSPIAPKGAELEGKLNMTLDSGKMHDGDTFTMTEHEGFFHKAPAALKGATIEGHVENVTAASATHKASMNVIIDDVKLADGTTAPVSAQLTFQPKSHLLRDSALVAGGFVVGHMAAGKHHGGIAGAAGGLALASSLKSNIKVRKGSVLHLKLKAALVPGSASSM